MKRDIDTNDGSTRFIKRLLWAGLLAISTCSIYAQAEIKAWSKLIGAAREDFGVGVAVDPSGNVFMGGPTQSSLGGQSAGVFDVFVGKCDASGNVLWLAQRGTDDIEYGWDDLHGGVAADPFGNVYVVGRTKGALDGNSNIGGFDLFVMKFGPTGTWLWTRQDGTGNNDTARAVATDAGGNVYVAGYVEAGNFHGLPRFGAADVFISKYGPDGTRLWSTVFGSGRPDEAFGLACDPSGNVIVTGWCDDSIEGIPNLGNGDNFLAKYDSNGQRLWLNQWGTVNKDTGYSVATDPSGNIYLSGYTTGPLYGSQQGNRDVFLAKFNAAGTNLWGTQLGTSERDEGWGVAVDSSGNAYVAGEASGPLGSDPWAGDFDLFVAKYNSAGSQVWLRQLGTASVDYGRAIAVDASGGVLVTGWSDGAFDGNTNQGSVDVVLMKYAPSNSIPPVPTARSATDLTTSGFTANWFNASFATGYRLDVSTNSAFSSYLAGYQDRDVGNVLSLSVGGLNPGTLCYYRVRAYNNYGTSSSSGNIAAATRILQCSPAGLLNGNFEGPVSAQGVITNWTGYVRAPNPPFVVWTNLTVSPPPGGALQYQQIQVTNSLGGGAGVRQTVTGCTTGATYIVSGWLRGNSDRIVCSVKVSPTDSTNWSTAIPLNPQVSVRTNAWTPFSGTVVAAGTNMTLWLDGEMTVPNINAKAACFDAITVSCPVVPVFRFESVTAAPPNRVSLLLSNAPYPNVTIQHSSDFMNWELLTNLVPTNGTVRYTDESASNAVRRYYRATSP